MKGKICKFDYVKVHNLDYIKTFKVLYETLKSLSVMNLG